MMQLKSSFIVIISIVVAHLRYIVGQDDTSAAKLASANNAFATNIYQVLKEDAKNLVCSPLSLSIVLSMLLEGAPKTSTTYNEIRSALSYNDLSLSEIEEGYKSLFKSLKSNEDYTLNLADSLWIDENFKAQENYINKVKDIFQADINSFNKDNGADVINKWVANHTMNKITKLLDKLDAGVVMVLVNAIYFQASWVQRFLESNNADGDFLSNDNSKSTTTFMQQQDSFQYFESETLNSQVLKLNYVGNEVSFVIVLPKKGNTLLQLEKDLKSEDIESAIKSANYETVNVKLPKFNISSSLPLNDPLQKLNIKVSFSDQADFSEITGAPNVKVSTVIQKAIIEVSENGTVAAAATAAELTLTAVRDEKPIDFTADHPFLFVLYHNPTSSILFIGRYTTP